MKYLKLFEDIFDDWDFEEEEQETENNKNTIDDIMKTVKNMGFDVTTNGKYGFGFFIPTSPTKFIIYEGNMTSELFITTLDILLHGNFQDDYPVENNQNSIMKSINMLLNDII